jgi:hypothetical protein
LFFDDMRLPANALLGGIEGRRFRTGRVTATSPMNAPSLG